MLGITGLALQMTLFSFQTRNSYFDKMMTPMLQHYFLAAVNLQKQGMSKVFFRGCKPFKRDMLSWSKWLSVRTLHRTAVVSSSLHRAERVEKNQRKVCVPEWTKPLTLKDPHLDMDYLLNPKNLLKIQENIINRKGVGDTQSLVRITNPCLAE